MLIPMLSAKLGWHDLTTRRLVLVLFAGAFLGFAVKVPLMPFHTWLPAAYAEAPTGTTMLLTGLMSKMGVYGFLRILLPIFPEEVHWLLTPLLWLAVFTIICSASAAFAQRDLKRMLAYSSINHLGYCMLGAFALLSSSQMAAAPAAEKVGRPERGVPADVQSRADGCHAVLVCRHARGAQRRVARLERLWRLAEGRHRCCAGSWGLRFSRRWDCRG